MTLKGSLINVAIVWTVIIIIMSSVAVKKANDYGDNIKKLEEMNFPPELLEEIIE